MPTSGQSQQPGSAQGGAGGTGRSSTGILIGLVVGALAVALVLFFLLNQKGDDSDETTPAPTTPPVVTQEPPPAPSPDDDVSTEDATPTEDAAPAEEEAQTEEPDPTAEPTEDPTDTDEAAGRGGEGDESTESPDEEEETSAGCTAPVEGAHPCAGGPLPEGAAEITSVIHSPYAPSSTAVLVTPSGNIGCDIGVGDGEQPWMACDVRSWAETGAPVEPVNSNIDLGYPIISFNEDGPPTYGGAKGDPFCFMFGACDQQVRAQVVDYGQVVYYDKFVCASEENGLTCWDTESGHGAFMSRDDFRTF